MVTGKEAPSVAGTIVASVNERAVVKNKIYGRGCLSIHILRETVANHYAKTEIGFGKDVTETVGHSSSAVYKSGIKSLIAESSYFSFAPNHRIVGIVSCSVGNEGAVNSDLNVKISKRSGVLAGNTRYGVCTLKGSGVGNGNVDSVVFGNGEFKTYGLDHARGSNDLVGTRGELSSKGVPVFQNAVVCIRTYNCKRYEHCKHHNDRQYALKVFHIFLLKNAYFNTSSVR